MCILTAHFSLLLFILLISAQSYLGIGLIELALYHVMTTPETPIVAGRLAEWIQSVVTGVLGQRLGLA